jgi:hypothetical protein
MKRLLVSLFVIVLAYAAHSQGKVDLDEIRRLTQDTNSRYFYDTLVNEFVTDPNNIELTKGKSIYYGKLFSRYYKAYEFSDDESLFHEQVEKQRFWQAIEIGERILHDDPINLDVLVNMFQCYVVVGLHEQARVTKRKLDVLYNCILFSGTGETRETAYRVISVGDEYAIIGMLGHNGLSRQSFVMGNSIIDSWTIRDEKTGAKKDLHFEVIVNEEAMSKLDR